MAGEPVLNPEVAARNQLQREAEVVASTLEPALNEEGQPQPEPFRSEILDEPITTDTVPTEVELSEDDLREQALERKAAQVDRGERRVGPQQIQHVDVDEQPPEIGHEQAVTEPVIDPALQSVPEEATPEALAPEPAPDVVDNAATPALPLTLGEDGQYYAKRKVNGQEELVPFDTVLSDSQKAVAATHNFMEAKKRQQALDAREAEIARREAALQAQPPGQPGAETPVLPNGARPTEISEEQFDNGIFGNDPAAKAEVIRRINLVTQPQQQAAPAQQATPDIDQVSKAVKWDMDRDAAIAELRKDPIYANLEKSEVFINLVTSNLQAIQEAEPLELTGEGPAYYLNKAFAQSRETLDTVARQMQQQADPLPTVPDQPAIQDDPRLQAKQLHASQILGAAASARSPTQAPSRFVEESPLDVKASMKREREAY